MSVLSLKMRRQASKLGVRYRFLFIEPDGPALRTIAGLLDELARWWDSLLSCTGWGGLCFRVGFFVGILGVGWSFRGTKAAVGSGG